MLYSTNFKVGMFYSNFLHILDFDNLLLEEKGLDRSFSKVYENYKTKSNRKA